MSDLLREFYGSDMCEASRSFKLSEEGESALAIRDEVYEKLEENLSKEYFELFERFVDASGIVWSEEVYNAYVSGMRDLIRFASGIFM